MSTGSNVGVVVGSSILKYGAASTGPAAPFVAAAGAVIAAASMIAGALHIGEGCGQTCIQATKIVNDAEPVFEQNVQLFQSGAISKTEALANFDTLWNAVKAACSGVPGAAGQNCIGDRQRGGKWDWFSYYRDPIEYGVETYSTQQQIGEQINTILGGNENLKIFGIGAVVLVGIILATRS